MLRMQISTLNKFEGAGGLWVRGRMVALEAELAAAEKERVDARPFGLRLQGALARADAKRKDADAAKEKAEASLRDAQLAQERAVEAERPAALQGGATDPGRPLGGLGDAVAKAAAARGLWAPRNKDEEMSE